MGDIINMDEPFLAATEEYKWRPCILKIKEKVENLISSVLSIQLVKRKIITYINTEKTT